MNPNLTRAGLGRPVGSKNKTTVAAKEAISMVFDKLGGVDAMVEWAARNDENRKAFYTSVYPKLLPLQVTGEGGGPLAVSWLPSA